MSKNRAKQHSKDVEIDVTYMTSQHIVDKIVPEDPSSMRYRLACYREERMLRDVVWLNNPERVDDMARQSKGGSEMYERLCKRYGDLYVASYDYQLYATNMTASSLPIAVGQIDVRPTGYHMHAVNQSVKKYLVMPGERVLCAEVVRNAVDYRYVPRESDIRIVPPVNKLYVSTLDQGFILRELVTLEFVFTNRRSPKEYEDMKSLIQMAETATVPQTAYEIVKDEKHESPIGGDQ
jgi:hypothetical protein